MKKYFLFILFISLTLNTFAQKEIKEGVIKVKMTMSSEDSQINSQLAMMGDLVMSTYFKGANSRTEMKNPMAGETITIVNSDKKKSLMLLNNPMLGKKYRESDIALSEEDLKNITVTEKGDTKTILGYVCKGYVFTIKKDGKENTVTMYTTEKIKAINQNNMNLGKKAKGFPMYMTGEISQPNGIAIKMVLEATEVKGEKIADAKFSLTVPEGYSKIEPQKPSSID
ncbi:hypothetical protein [Pseudotenacibaculum haliotis]|uniref:DUF4412 domain-containing protein n=1 Tax=Pseudotenacibaculum haliotis TaxID=1862138 RepID=A0ABW5LPN8_9FLAO